MSEEKKFLSQLYQPETEKLKREIEKAKDRLTKLRCRYKQNNTPTTTTTPRSINDWRSTYSKFQDYEDEDELDHYIEQLELKLKQRLNVTPKPHSFCCSQNRREERRVANLTLESRLDEMRLYREEGCRCYRANNYEAALKLFEKSLLFSEYCFPQSMDEKQKVQDEREICLLNSSACYIAQREFHKSISSCQEVLEMTEGKNTKALYRLSKCYRKLMIFDRADEYIQMAKSSLKDDSDTLLAPIQEEEAFLRNAIVKYERDSKKMAKRMLSSGKK